MNTIELRNKIMAVLEQPICDEDSLDETFLERRIDEVLGECLKAMGIKLQFNLSGELVIYNPPAIDLFDQSMWIPARTTNSGFKVIYTLFDGTQLDSSIGRIKFHLIGNRITLLDDRHDEYVKFLLEFYSTKYHSHSLENTIITKVCENDVFDDDSDVYYKDCELMIIRLQQNGLYNIDYIDTHFCHDICDGRIVLHDKIESFIDEPRLLMESDYLGTIISEDEFCDYFKTTYHASRLA